MERFNVVIRFPHDKKGDTVTITGLEENVEDAKEHLLMLAEDYVSPFSLVLSHLVFFLFTLLDAGRD